MGKLFDLMIMGFRYQILQCCQPSEILHVTMKHLETLKGTLDYEQSVLPLIAATEARLVQMCQSYNQYDYQLVRIALYKVLDEPNILTYNLM